MRNHRKASEFVIYSPGTGFVTRSDRSKARSTQNSMSARGQSNKSWQVLRRAERTTGTRPVVMPNGIRIRLD